jgi:hypothetical protein
MPTPSGLSHRVLFSALIVALALGQAAPARADTPGQVELSRWLATSAAARRYRDVQESLGTIVAVADRQNLPSVVLVERVKEGAAKGAAPEALVAAAQAELDRLRMVEAVLREAGAGDLADSERVYRTLSLGLRAGLSAAAVRAILGDLAGSAETLGRSLAACEAVLSLSATTRLSEAELVRLGRALIDGKVPTGALGTVNAVFAKGRAGKLDDGELLAIVAGVLDRGGGIIQISGAVDAEVRRRSRDR